MWLGAYSPTVSDVDLKHNISVSNVVVIMCMGFMDYTLYSQLSNCGLKTWRDPCCPSRRCWLCVLPFRNTQNWGEAKRMPICVLAGMVVPRARCCVHACCIARAARSFSHVLAAIEADNRNSWGLQIFPPPPQHLLEGARGTHKGLYLQ